MEEKKHLKKHIKRSIFFKNISFSYLLVVKKCLKKERKKMCVKNDIFWTFHLLLEYIL